MSSTRRSKPSPRTDTGSRLRLHRLVVALIVAAVVGCASRPTASGAPVPDRGACFALGTLTPDERRAAEDFVLAAGDREGLHTLDGGLKPISSDIAQRSFRVWPSVDQGALAELSRWQRAARALHCGPIEVAVQVFAARYPGREGDSVRTASVVVGHREAIARLVTRHEAFFGRLGITAATPLGELMQLVDIAPSAERWRAYGLVFGYPEAAIDFFVVAGLRGDSTRQVEPRDFVRLPTWTKFAPPVGERDSLTTFVYAVPKGAPRSSADSALLAATSTRYARYRAWRAAAPRGGAEAVAYWRDRLTTTSTP